jgi:hypothetical protein
VNITENIALDLIDRIYRAAAEREEWTSFCSALAVAVGGAAVAVNLEHPRPGEKGLAYSTGFDPAYRESFRRHYFALEPWEEPNSQLPVGALAFGAHLVPDEVVLRLDEAPGVPGWPDTGRGDRYSWVGPLLPRRLPARGGARVREQ